MRRHIVKRGSRYHYICRVPSDLLLLLPSPVISRSLRTSDKKYAALFAVSIDYYARQLFTNLKTGMLEKTLQKRLML